MQYLKSQMPSTRYAKHEHYMYTVGVFAVVCVVADLVVSCLSQISEAQVQNMIFVIAVTVSAFIAGSVSAGRKATHDKVAPVKKLVLPAKKSVQAKSNAREGDHEARQHAAKSLIQAMCMTPMASPVQAAQPAESQPAESAVQPEASRADRDAKPQLESSQRPLTVPRHDLGSSTGARVSTEIEDTASKSLGGTEIGQSEVDAPAACGCMMDDVVGLADDRGRTCPVDAGISRNDPTCNVQEEASAADEPHVLHTATERTPLRREASTFVPTTCWKDPLQTPSEVSLLCWVPYPPPGLCDEFPQMTMQQMGSQCEDRTTVMLRNLPWNFRREDLIKEMDAKGFAGLYDFVYMPIDFKTMNCMGYAFANLVTSEEAQRLILAFDGFKDWPHRSSKVCAASLSRTQGLEANVLRHQNSPIMSDEVPERLRPVLFSGTRRVPFLEFMRELPKRGGCCPIELPSIREYLHKPVDL